MRIVFFGSGEFGLPTLRALIEAHDVRLVISQPDRPAGRNRALTPTPIAAFAAERGITTLKPLKCNTPEIREAVRAAEPDANVVIAFGQKIGAELIASPRLGAMATMNLHASLLPKYRGAAPIHWAIVKGEKITGNTLFSLVEKMDAGPVLGMQQTEIGPLETTGELHDRLAAMGPGLVLEVLKQLETGSATATQQDESGATLAPKLSRADAVIDFTFPAETIRWKVHGLTPWPGVTVWWSREGGGAREALMLRRVRDHACSTCGRAGDYIGDGRIATGHGVLEMLEVQPPGKRQMSFEEFNRGVKLPMTARFYGTEK